MATRWVIFATSGMTVWILCKSLLTCHCHSSKCSVTDRRPSKQVYLQVRENQGSNWYASDTCFIDLCSRQLLPLVLRNPICALDGLLLDPDLYPLFTHRCHLMGLLLAEPGSNPSKSDTRCDHSAHYDLTYILHQLPTAQDLLHEVHWYLSKLLLHHGVCISDWWVILLGDVCPGSAWRRTNRWRRSGRRCYRGGRSTWARFCRIIMSNNMTMLHHGVWTQTHESNIVHKTCRIWNCLIFQEITHDYPAKSNSSARWAIT